MKFVETNKHRHIEKDTMELAISWYHRYIEKEEQIEKIEQSLINFEEWLIVRMSNEATINIGELQRAWSKTINL